MMAATLKNKIITFEENTKGTDYVLGDIHGRFDLVYQNLKAIEFDENKDRLFCVGDLIDRGQYSGHVVDFLKLSYVHTVRGNHEDMLLEFYEDNPHATDEEFYRAGVRNGMEWFLDNSHEKRAAILEALSLLPLVIEINHSRGLVGLVHADVPSDMSWSIFKDKIEKGDSKIIETALWGRSRLTQDTTQDIEGLGRLYVGHTVQNHIKKLGNVVALDTGAVFNRHLSMVNIACESQLIINPHPPQGEIFHVKSQAYKPFGKR